MAAVTMTMVKLVVRVKNAVILMNSVVTVASAVQVIGRADKESV